MERRLAAILAADVVGSRASWERTRKGRFGRLAPTLRSSTGWWRRISGEGGKLCRVTLSELATVEESGGFVWDFYVAHYLSHLLK